MTFRQTCNAGLSHFVFSRFEKITPRRMSYVLWGNFFWARAIALMETCLRLKKITAGLANFLSSWLDLIIRGWPHSRPLAGLVGRRGVS
jgi:hypothetical protein